MTATIIPHPAAVARLIAAVLDALTGDEVAALCDAVDRPSGPHLTPDRPGQIVLDGGYAPLHVLQALVRYRLATPEVHAGWLVGVTLNAAGVAIRHHLTVTVPSAG